MESFFLLYWCSIGEKKTTRNAVSDGLGMDRIWETITVENMEVLQHQGIREGKVSQRHSV